MSVDTRPPDHILVEMALTTKPDDPAPVWVDITAWVELKAGVSITAGRADEFAEVQAGSMHLTLNNSDGRFTAGNTASPYWPNIKVRKKIRLSYQNPSGPGPRSYRHTGYLEEPSTEWPGGNAYSTAQISTSGRFKRLGRANPLRSIITQEYLADAPAAYFTLGEPGGSTSAGDTSRNGGPALVATQVGIGGLLTFGANTGPATDGLSAPAFVPVDAVNGVYLSASIPRFPDPAPITVEAFILTSGAVQQVVARTLGSLLAIQVAVTAAGKVEGSSPGSNAFVTITSAGSVNDGVTHHVVLTAAGAVVTLYVDGVSVGSAVLAAGCLFRPSLVDVGGVSAFSGAGAAGDLFAGTIAHVALYDHALSPSRVAAHYQAGSSGFSGERSDQRIARLAGYAGVPSGEQSLEVGMSTSIAHADTTGQSVVAAMQAVAATENGVLFIDGAGVLTFHARSHRYNTASGLTVGAADIDPSARFVTNDALLVNDVTASRPAGATVRVVNAASMEDYGTAAVSVVLLTTSDAEVADAAAWKANQSAEIKPRLPSLAVDLMTSPGLHAAAMLLTLGSRITLAGLPSQAPEASMDFYIEGWSEQISLTSWVLAWNLSPASKSSVWQLDSPIFSQLNVSTRLAY